MMPDDRDEQDSFLARWSRRKLDPAAAGQAPVPDGSSGTDAVSGEALDTRGVENNKPRPGRMITEPIVKDRTIDSAATNSDDAQTVATPISGESEPTRDPAADDDGPPPTEADIEALDKNSDYRRYMKPDVSPELRRMALRKLWLSDPVLANVDGLVDYGEDFTDKALAVKVLKTAYRVGKGFLSDEEVAAQERIGRPDREEEKQDVSETGSVVSAMDVEAGTDTSGCDDAGSAGADADAQSRETGDQNDTETRIASSDACDTKGEKAGAAMNGSRQRLGRNGLSAGQAADRDGDEGDDTGTAEG